MENNLDWDTPSPVGEEAVLDPYANTVVSAPLPEKEAKKRAAKISVAFSGEEKPPSYEEILADVQTQREDRLKDRLATSESLKKTQLKQNLIREVVDSGDSSPEALSFLQGLSAEEIVDKEGILEKKYSEWRMNLGLSSDESGTVDKSMESEAVSGQVDSSVDRIFRNEVAGAAAERARAKYEQTGIGRTLLDFGFSLLPWAEAQEAKNLTPDNVQAEGILPSTVRRSQVRDLYAMPAKEFQAAIAQMEKEADDAGDWAPFIKLMDDLRNYSAYQGQVDNVYAIASLVELAPGGLVFDAVKGVGRVGIAGGRAVSRIEAQKAAQEAVLGAASKGGSPTTPKAAGEASSPPSAAPAPGVQATTKKPSLREETVDPDGRRWPPAMGPKIDREAVTGYEGMSDKALQERYQYIERKLYPDPEGGVGNNGLSVEEQNKLVDELSKIGPEYDKRSVTPGNSLYIPEEAAGPSDRERILSIANTGKEPVLTEKEVVLSAVAEKAAGSVIKGTDGRRYTIDGLVIDNETIKNAAVRFDGKIYEGLNHGLALDNAATSLGKTQDELIETIDQNTEGFVTSTGRFISREEALKVAKKSKQAKQGTKNYLGSEDIIPAPPKAGEDEGVGHIIVDVPNAKTGGASQIQVPATEENLARAYISNVEASGMRDMSDDPAALHAAHGDLDRAAIVEALSRGAKKGLFATIKERSVDLFRKLPSIYDPTGAVVGRPNFVPNQKLANNLAEGKYKPIVERQLEVNEKLRTVFEESESMGALRLSEDVFDAIEDLAVTQTKKELKSPSSAVLNISFRREWESTARTNEVVYHLGTPDGRAFVDLEQVRVYAEDMYGLLPGNYGIRTLNPTNYVIEVAKVIDETDPNILKMAIQTDTKTPVSFVNTFVGFLRSPGEISSETLRQNLRVSTHHANKLHEAFVVAAQDIGRMTKKEIVHLEALMDAKRSVEKIVYDPVSNTEKKVIGEWFQTAADLEGTYKRAFGEYPSENVVSAYFTMRQMYDFDLLHRNLKLYSEKTRKGFKQIRPYIPIPDDRNPGMVKWVQMKKGFEGKVLDELPSGDFDVIVLDAERAQAHHFKTAKSGKEGIKDLQSKGYRIIQLAAPNQLPLKNVKNVYANIIVTKDVDVADLSLNQLPATEGGHIRYSESVYLKQPKYVVTEDGEKLHVGDTTILGMSSDAEGAKRMADYDTGRQLLKAGDIQGLVAHLRGKIPMTVGEFEALFKPTIDNTGKVVKEPLLDLDTPIVWVKDGQGTNDAAKTHAPQLQEAFKGVRDTLDDPLNDMSGIDKKYTGEKDSTLSKIVDQDGVLSFQKARMISPMETLEQAWAEIARNIATDNMKIQAMTTWVEEAADALMTPLEKLRQNPWEALNNPQWNQQYGDLAKIRTLDAQRKQILNFLAQKDQLGSSLDWMRNKLLDSVFNKKGQQAADFVDDHVLPNVRNPLAFARSFAFHTKMGFFNPIQLFLQSNTMINTWAITGDLKRVGSARSGITLMQMSRINRTPEILADLARKSEKLGWKPGEWLEMDELFHKLALHTVEGEHGAIDVMTNPKMFKGVGGMFLDKGLMFFREGERAVRMNAWAVAFKEFRDQFPTKVITNVEENRILSRAQVLMAMMNRGDNALWQKGLTGPMTQFWGYQARIMEQLLGKQLTRAEKLRLGTAFAAMYGMPVSLSAATMFQIPGWSTDDLRQYALENNIDVNSGLLSIVMNGAPAEAIRWMTSDENGQGGLLLDIGGRYGPGGLPVIKNLLEAKDGVADVIIDFAFGASGSITRDFFKNALPEDWDILESATNSPKTMLLDLAGTFSTISTVNNATKLYWAMTTHQNMTRDGMNLGDKSSLSAFISFVTGLEEQRFKDTFLKMGSLKDLKAANDELGKEYLRQIRQAKLLPPGSEERKRKIAKARMLLTTLDPKDQKRYVKLALKPSSGLEGSIESSFSKEFKE